MAKRHSSKKTSISQLALFAAAAFGIAATCMIFLTALTLGSENQSLFKGTETVFGKEGFDLGFLVNTYMPFNFLAMLAYLLPVVAGVLALIAGKSKIIRAIAVLLFVAAAVLLFVQTQYVYTVSESGLLGSTSKSTPEWGLGIGAILGGVFSGIGALATAYTLIK